MRVRFSDVLNIINGKNQKQVENPNGKYPIYGSGGIMGYADSYICEPNTVIIGRKGSINKPIYVEVPFWNVDTAFGLYADKSKLIPKYLYYFCEKFDFEKLSTTVTIPSLTKANLLDIEMQLPPLDEQYRIVGVLDKVCGLIVKRQSQLNMLDELVKSRFIEMFGDPEYNTKNLPVFKLSKLCNVGSSKRIYQSEQSAAGIPFLRISDLNDRIDKGIETSELFIPFEKYTELHEQGLVPEFGDILVTSRGTLGKCYIVKKTDNFYFQDGMISWLSEMDENGTSLCIAHLFAMPDIRKQIANLQVGSTVAYLSIAMLKKLDIMLPPLETQHQYSVFVQQTDKLELAVQKSLEKLEILKKSLMQQYFG